MKKAIILSALLTLAIPFGQAKAEEAPTYRISGKDRYETAVNISAEGWDTSAVAVIATGKDFPDALSATPLAYKYGAPLLLTSANSLPASVKNELMRLKVKSVYLIGGKSVISLNIEKELNSLGISSITRLSGADRYETSVKVAKQLGNSDSVVVATGEGFADALSIAPIAAQLEMPILLTKRGSVPSSVSQFVKTEMPLESFVIGGTGVISEQVAKSFPEHERISGVNRYATNSSVIEYFEPALDLDFPVIATGENYPDALAGSAFAAATWNPVILTHPTKPHQTTIDTVQTYSDYAELYYVLGGDKVVTEQAINSLFQK
ncbi:cell wall-binding repeat-containing protein [Cytobacillus firmus]|uniref:cell wall-binding repeat-containing protein n=1 Tax=Cytobacillus firmus TaxID=1399 RepID=UPI0021619A87|nr:cell wall-binding repeat-containing protein [Cytobacillus firmus]MCS0670414.1 cell wall-binding repeat-containing protein [Cytobacillus firmus]